jgi:hypothetical protein
MSEEFVLRELRTLKEADSGWEAGPEVEARLLRALRRQRVRRVWKRSALAAVAAGVVGMLVVQRTPVQPSPALEVAPPARTVAEVSPTPALKPSAARIGRSAKRTRIVKIQDRPFGEVATEFFPLMDTPPPFEHGELLRVVVPAEAMRTVGLPVSESHLNDPVQADILVGQEGLARAIRFVNYQQ